MKNSLDRFNRDMNKSVNLKIGQLPKMKSREACGNLQCQHTHIESQEEAERAERIFEEAIAKNFPKFD